jgi:hypothetical protein
LFAAFINAILILGATKVAKERIKVGIKHDIGGLEVPMKDAVSVHVHHGAT